MPPILALLLLSAAAADAGTLLNDTGITLCDGGSGVHNNDFDCSRTTDDQGDPVPPGQDGHFGRDVTHNDDSDGRAGFSFTKIGANGSLLANSALSWDCVRDNVTGLMWEVKTNDGGLRDQDWSYTWYNPDSNTNGGSAGTANGGICFDSANCDTAKFVAEVNAAGLCGFHDWRLPGFNALRSIIDYSVPYPGPKIDVNWFPNATAIHLWSASPVAFENTAAWNLNFHTGGENGSKKYVAVPARLVRGGN